MNKLIKWIKYIYLLKNWPECFLYYSNLTSVNFLLLRLREGLKLKIKKTREDKSGLSAFNDVWIRDYYRKDKFEIKEGDTILDIGANSGMFSIYASKFTKSGKVLAFEPFKENLSLLKENLELNKIKNVFPFEYAVSDRRGHKNLIISENNLCHSFYMKQRVKGKVKVKTLSLLDIIRDNNLKIIDFLKMDCEGAEYEILFGSSKETLKKIKKICLEYHNLNDKLNCLSLVKFLEFNGFLVNTEKISIDNGYEYGYVYAVRD